MRDPVALLLADQDLARELVALGVLAQQLLEQLGGAQDVPARLLEEVEELAVPRGKDAGEAHSARNLALSPLEAGQLHAARGQLSDALPAPRPTAAWPVVLHAPVLDRARRRSPHRRRGGRRPSGIPTLPGLTSSMPPGPSRLKAMCVWPNTTRLGVDAGEQLRVVVGGLGRKLFMSEAARRGRRACRRSRRLRERGELLHELVAEQLRGALRDVADRCRGVVAIHEPAVGVAADPGASGAPPAARRSPSARRPPWRSRRRGGTRPRRPRRSSTASRAGRLPWMS